MTITLPERCEKCGEDRMLDRLDSGSVFCLVCSHVTKPVQKVEL